MADFDYGRCDDEGSAITRDNSLHLGGIASRQCLELMGLSVTGAAMLIGFAEKSVSEAVNERSGVFVVMAVRVSKAFGLTAETWFGMQTAYDLWKATQWHLRYLGREKRGGLIASGAVGLRNEGHSFGKLDRFCASDTGRGHC